MNSLELRWVWRGGVLLLWLAGLVQVFLQCSRPQGHAYGGGR